MDSKWLKSIIVQNQLSKRDSCKILNMTEEEFNAIDLLDELPEKISLQIFETLDLHYIVPSGLSIEYYNYLKFLNKKTIENERLLEQIKNLIKVLEVDKNRLKEQIEKKDQIIKKLEEKIEFDQAENIELENLVKKLRRLK